MAKESVFKRWGPWKTAFIFVAVFITLMIIANIAKPINEDITNNAINSFANQLVESCGMPESQGGAGFIGVQLQRCEAKMKEGAQLSNIQLEDCRKCGLTKYGENQLCLTGEDADFCEESIPLIHQARTQGIAQLGSSIESFTNFFDNLTTAEIFAKNSVWAWITGLAVLGFFVGGGRIKDLSK